ncbi:MAG: carbamoyltransferase HypF [Candidatus Zixiibacteriota bacterium]|nr:MAG: carbamoyltransferase HypF [candidate division Zixibacteria bacterium]
MVLVGKKSKDLITSSSRARFKIRVNGIVQGVGFRPFAYRLANELNLAGFVINSSDGVVIEIEGPKTIIDEFYSRLMTESPALSQITESDIAEIDAVGENDFVIKASKKDRLSATLISPDIATCDDCLRELFDPADRRYRYPFTNCTNCGPRYTIVESIPYDRAKTSMKVFPMCADCLKEYNDPANRRFHAQPNACPVCGPQLMLYDRKGQIDVEDPLREVVNLLRNGNIIAVRGIGGFHLAVDGYNNDAILELRKRKGRAEKPFALMAPDIVSIKKFCFVSKDENKLLTDYTRPIVLLRKKPVCDLAESIAPNNIYLGFMLAYSPLHHLLLRDNFDALVMTSGNYSEEPIAIFNDEALQRIKPLSDYFLLHDREILQRCDDSIARIKSGTARMIRRSRGYVPRPVFLPKPLYKRILAVGGELKNTIALSRGNTVFLSQHIGDLDNPSAYSFFENSIDHLKAILEIEPELIACDLHPEYLSTKWAKKQNKLPVIEIQHHHAHLVSVMSENGITDKTMGIIYDGTGYGTDGSIWGGEILIGDAAGYERPFHLEPVPMPGGTAAIQNPWRMAVSHLYKSYGDDLFKLDLPILRVIGMADVGLIVQMIRKNINSPLTSSCGRLFDAVSAILGIRNTINFEAQAAMELEMAIDENCSDYYEDAVSDLLSGVSINTTPLIKAVVNDILKGEDVGVISAKFHRTLAEISVKAVKRIRERYKINTVGLSGGVFQNGYFFNHLYERLNSEGFNVITHSKVPTNDGGLSLGQIVIADNLYRMNNQVSKK